MTPEGIQAIIRFARTWGSYLLAGMLFNCSQMLQNDAKTAEILPNAADRHEFAVVIGVLAVILVVSATVWLAKDSGKTEK